MFVHVGSRSVWPVIIFLPWFLLGFGYLLESLLRRRPGSAPIQRTQRGKAARR